MYWWNTNIVPRILLETIITTSYIHVCVVYYHSIDIEEDGQKEQE